LSIKIILKLSPEQKRLFLNVSYNFSLAYIIILFLLLSIDSEVLINYRNTLTYIVVLLPQVKLEFIPFIILNSFMPLAPENDNSINCCMVLLFTVRFELCFLRIEML
jgi:hypothetical protein